MALKQPAAPPTSLAFDALLPVPDDTVAKARAMRGEGRLAEADALCRQALVRTPGHAEATHELGILVHQTGRIGDAIRLIHRAMRLDQSPRRTDGLMPSPGRLAEAIAACQRTLALLRDCVTAHINFGIALSEQGNSAAAVTAFRTALVLAPDCAEALNNIGYIDRRNSALARSVVNCGRAVAVNPHYVKAHINIGIAHMLAGAFDRGWREMEWRRFDKATAWHFDQPQWLGEPVPPSDPPRRVLVHAELGMGDTIEFSRFVPLAAARAKVIFRVPRALRRLLAPLEPRVELIAADAPLPAFDYHAPLMSLPLVFGTTPATIPPPSDFLFVDAERIARWRARLPSSGIRVGIAWQNIPAADHENRTRAIPLTAFAPLARIPGVRLISLQHRHGLDQLDALPADMPVLNLGPTFDAGDDAFLDSVAVIASLDLVITIDSNVAHLAGSQGRPVWVALQKVPNWPWQIEGDTTPWYPSARLFRQTEPGDWTGVVAKMAAGLAALARLSVWR